MHIRTEVLLGISVLVLLQVLTAFGAIGLLSRMSPAVERILQENVYSNQAAGEMLAMIALSDSVPLQASAPGFLDGLQKLRRNVTEQQEIPVIEKVDLSWRRAAAGDESARQETVDALLQLIAINQDAMRAADEDAKRLGSAGAWAAVFLALVGFLFSALVVLRLRQRVLTPLEDLSATLEAARRGDQYRRCQLWSAPSELRSALAQVNRLLDERQTQKVATAKPTFNPERDVALFLMDQKPSPVFVVDSKGTIVLANRSGLDELSRDGELKKRLLEAPQSDAGFSPEQRRPIGDQGLWWVESHA